MHSQRSTKSVWNGAVGSVHDFLEYSGGGTEGTGFSSSVPEPKKGWRREGQERVSWLSFHDEILLLEWAKSTTNSAILSLAEIFGSLVSLGPC